MAAHERSPPPFFPFPSGGEAAAGERGRGFRGVSLGSGKRDGPPGAPLASNLQRTAASISQRYDHVPLCVLRAAVFSLLPREVKHSGAEDTEKGMFIDYLTFFPEESASVSSI